MVLPFAGGVSLPLSVVSLLFSASYPQDRRSYYLFFNYLFFNYLYGYPECPYFGRLGVSRMPVFRASRGIPNARGKCPESHKPVEIGDLGPCGAWVGAGYTEVNPGKAAERPERGD